MEGDSRALSNVLFQH